MQIGAYFWHYFGATLAYHPWLPSLWPTTENPNMEFGFLSYLTFDPKSTLNPPDGTARVQKAANTQHHLAANGRTNQAMIQRRLYAHF